VGGSRWRAWVEKTLPWYHPHTERLRNVRSAVIARLTADTTEQAQRVMDDYRAADRVVRRER